MELTLEVDNNNKLFISNWFAVRLKKDGKQWFCMSCNEVDEGARKMVSCDLCLDWFHTHLHLEASLTHQVPSLSVCMYECL